MTATTSPSASGSGNLWRAIAAPVAAGVLAAGCAVTQPPNEIRVMAPSEPLAPALAAERARRYAQLETALAEDPQTQGRILLVDPSRYTSGRQLLGDTKIKLQAMIATWPEAPEKYVQRPIVMPMSDIVSKENESLAPVNSGLFIKRNGETSPDLTLYLLAHQTFRHEALSLGDKDFICTAVGERAQNRRTTVVEHFKSFGFAPQTSFTAAFSQAIEEIDPTRMFTTKHEVGHCLGAVMHQRDETLLLKSRREETKADISDIFLDMQEGQAQGKPFDVQRTLETLVQWRRADQVRGFLKEGGATDHDTMTGLRLLQREAQGNPRMADDLQGLSISELGNRAARYAERASLIDYPHLADQSLDAKTRYAMTQKLDDDFEFRARFVSGHMLIKGFKEMPQTLSADTALGIAQLAYAAENYLVQPPHSQLKQAMTELRQKFPQQMREADRKFAAELREFPPLPDVAASQTGTTSLRRGQQNYSRLSAGAPGT